MTDPARLKWKLRTARWKLIIELGDLRRRIRTGYRTWAAWFGYVVLALTFIAGLAVTFAAGLRLWRVPAWYLDNRAGTIANAIDSYRAANTPMFSALIQALGGSLVVAGLYLTWRQLSMSRLQQVRDTFSRAIDHLGSDRGAVRVAAMHILERVAVENPTESEAVLRVLETFVRACLETAAQPQPTKWKFPMDAVAAINTYFRITTLRARTLPLEGYWYRGWP